MTPGPNKILKIPASGTLVKITTAASGNNLGMRIWTDGKMEAPMLADNPWLRRQPVTGELFWTDECEEAGEEEPWEPDAAFKNVPFAADPRPDDYRAALANALATTPRKEKYIRIRLWWGANDAVRKSGTGVPQDEDFRQNLLKLSALLDIADVHERYMALEAHRELGDFEKVNECLRDFEFPENYGAAVALIRKLAGEEDSTVREIVSST